MANVTTPWTESTPVGADVSVPEIEDDVLDLGYPRGTLTMRSRRNNGAFEFLCWGVMAATLDTFGFGDFSGAFALQIPTAPLATNVRTPRWVVPAVACDVSAKRYYAGTGLLYPSSFAGIVTLELVLGTNVKRAGPAVPFTWAAGDWFIAGNAAEAFDN